MPSQRVSRLTSLPYDILHQVLSLVLPSLPDTVHLNLHPCPSYLGLFRSSSDPTPCPPIVLVCRLLTRHCLRIIYAQTRVLLHPSRLLLTRLSRLKARKYLLHIDLAVELRARVRGSYDTKTSSSTHDHDLISFYSPAYLIDLLHRIFPKLQTVHLTIIETVPPPPKPTSYRFNNGAPASQTSASTEDEATKHFPPSSLTQSSTIDPERWNDLITSVRYKTSPFFTTFSPASIPLHSPSTPSSPNPTFLNLFNRPFRPSQPFTNDQWRDRTRRLINSASPLASSPTAPPPLPIDNTEGEQESSIDTGGSVTSFILADDFSPSSADAIDGPGPAIFTSPAPPPAPAPSPALPHPPASDLLASALDLLRDSSSSSDLQLRKQEAFCTHLTARFGPFSPPTLPNLRQICFYATTTSSHKLPHSPNLQPPAMFTSRIGDDGAALRDKFDVLLSDELFGGVGEVKVRKVVVEGTGSNAGEELGWEEMQGIDLARVFGPEGGEGRDGKRRRVGVRFADL